MMKNMAGTEQPTHTVKRSLSKSTTPTAMASTRVALAQSPWQPCPFTPRYWSITCHRSHPPRVGWRATPHPLPCPERERGNERGNERGSVRHTAKERKVTGEKGVRGNWCS
ncbi:transcription factor SOX-13-like protein [Lates japonicus]|uniref:Transcription factor SOX-13-like protein n=1 Tax=Lates japonicus TaxID=270547 RepID=A0AAD3MVR8_LATJO|nr:transcription factor SOX-13-like protein [Lates japonicus]